MPWAIFNRPSIQLGALKSFLNTKSDEILATNLHPYLDIANILGTEPYRIISENNWAGEALYSGLLFPEQKKHAEEVFTKSLNNTARKNIPEYAELLFHLQSHMEKWLLQHDFSSFDLLGFSVCFSQLLPSIYAAQSIKKQLPDIPIVFGGSTCTPETSLSLLQAFPSIDYIITGEGENPLLGLCKHILGNKTEPGANVLTRKNLSYLNSNQEIKDLNHLPVPNYDEYFTALKEQKFDFIPVVPIEFSRGCWWNKCTFCNLNLQWQGYRYKKSKRMLKEYDVLKNRYQSLDFTFTDNALPPKESALFFDNLAKKPSTPNFFAEIRVLPKRESYAHYRAGGLKSVQVGIEALSNSLLDRMKKGVSALENIAAMRHATESGIVLEGNLILEFPGSTENEITETLRALEAVLPFNPLKGASFFLGMGSPVSCSPGQYNIKSVHQHPYNSKLYPDSILRNLKLLIQSYRGDRSKQRQLWQPVRKKLQLWAEFHAKRPDKTVPPLSYRDGETFLIIRQEQLTGKVLHHRLRGMSRKIYLACQEIISKKELLAEFNSIKREQIFSFLNDLESKHLVFTNKEHVLALAVKNIQKD